MFEHIDDQICSLRLRAIRPGMRNEIVTELQNGQKVIDRHDLTARVFKQNLKSLMDFVVKHHVFGEVRCWMYSIEWQKCGLPHASCAYFGLVSSENYF